MMILTHAPTGAAYTTDDHRYGVALLYTPLHEDMTFDPCVDNWAEVEDRDEVADGILSILLRARELDPEFEPVD